VDLQIDDSKWPVIFARWPAPLTDAQLDEFYRRMDGWLLRGEQFGLLLDTTGAFGLTREQRERFIEYMKKNTGLLERYLVQAIVIDNPILRALYYGISWAYPMPFASKSFGEAEAAREWLVGTLRARGARVEDDAHPAP
jgi:hypothetical protein